MVTEFRRLMFGLSPSSFVLKGTIKYHLDQYQQCQPQSVMEFKQSMKRKLKLKREEENNKKRSQGENKKFKENTVKNFDEAGFKLHQKTAVQGRYKGNNPWDFLKQVR